MSLFVCILRSALGGGRGVTDSRWSCDPAYMRVYDMFSQARWRTYEAARNATGRTITPRRTEAN